MGLCVFGSGGGCALSGVNACNEGCLDGYNEGVMGAYMSANAITSSSPC